MTRDTRDTARSIKRLERRIDDLEAQRTSGGLVTILRSANPQVALRVSFTVDGVEPTGPDAETLTWNTESDWDAAQSESNVHHQQPANTDWAAADRIELGYQPTDPGGAALDGYYPFDEDSGSTAYNLGGTGNDGTTNGATVGETGILGTTAYTFDGTDDYIEFSDTYLPSSADFTFAIWVNVDAVSDGTDAVVLSSNGNGTTFYLYATTTFGDANNEVRVWETNTGQLLVGNDLRGAGWTHLAVTRSGDDFTLYEDGVQVDSTTNTVSFDVGSDDFNIGRGNFERYYAGDVDESLFFSRSLSQSELQTLAHEDTPTGGLTTTAKQSGLGQPTTVTTTSSLNDGSIDIVVHQDTNKDGVSDNSETISLAGGVDETNTLAGTAFESSSDADYFLTAELSVSNPSDVSPTVSEMQVTIE